DGQDSRGHAQMADKRVLSVEQIEGFAAPLALTVLQEQLAVVDDDLEVVRGDDALFRRHEFPPACHSLTTLSMATSTGEHVYPQDPWAAGGRSSSSSIHPGVLPPTPPVSNLAERI